MKFEDFVVGARKLGEGGAGQLQLATLQQPLSAFEGRPGLTGYAVYKDVPAGTPVAIKRYRPAIVQDHNELRRLSNEYALACKSSGSPNLVEMYASGRDEAGPFLVYQFIDGMTLRDWTRLYHRVSDPYGVAVARLGRDILRAMAHLHERDILHRDIKPTNVMVDTGMRAVVVDLSVARMPASPPRPNSINTVGSHLYSAPEVLAGCPYEGPADVYSFGAVLYELVTGGAPFVEYAGDHAALQRAVQFEEPSLDPSITGVATLKSLFDAARAAMAKDPRSRPSVDDLSDNLLTIIDQHPSGEAEPLRGYIATALTRSAGDDGRIAFVTNLLADTAMNYGLFLYQPRIVTSPVTATELPAEVVYDLDRKRLQEADLVVLVADEPSFGAGQEIEIATALAKPMLLIVRQDTRVSRMVLGSFAYQVAAPVCYNSPEDLRSKFARTLRASLPAITSAKQASREDPALPLAKTLGTLRAQKGFAIPADLASAANLPSRLVEAIERDEAGHVSLQAVARLARALDVPIATLVSPTASTAGAPPAAGPSGELAKLYAIARASGWSAADMLALKEDRERELAASGGKQQLTEGDWGARYLLLHSDQTTQGGGSASPKPEQRSMFDP